MIGIQGLGNVPEPTGPKQTSGRARAQEKVEAPVTDDVLISAAAEKAADADVILQQSGEMNDVREQRIEQARQNIQDGTYKVNDVVRQVAARLTRFVS